MTFSVNGFNQYRCLRIAGNLGRIQASPTDANKKARQCRAFLFCCERCLRSTTTYGNDNFYLVIGADGLHSSVRRQVFGPESDFERHLGIMVSVFVLDGYEPRDELVGVTRTTVGRQVLRFAQRDGSTVVALTLVPIVLAYTVWSYWVFRKRISTKQIPAEPAGLPAEYVEPAKG